MSRCLVSMSLLILLVCVHLAASAPTTTRLDESEPESRVIMVLNKNTVHKELAKQGHRTKRSTTLSNMFKLRSIDTESGSVQIERRTPRSIRNVEEDTFDFLSEQPAKSRHGRGRRSAAWWLHASIQMCEKYEHLCRKIEVQEGNVVLELRIEDM